MGQWNVLWSARRGWTPSKLCFSDVVVVWSSSTKRGKSTGNPDTMTRLICYLATYLEDFEGYNWNGREVKWSGVQVIWYGGNGPSSSVRTLLSWGKLCIHFSLYYMNRYWFPALLMFQGRASVLTPLQKFMAASGMWHLSTRAAREIQKPKPRSWEEVDGCVLNNTLFC